MRSLTYVELDIDYCSLRYGESPCTAAAGTNLIPASNTFSAWGPTNCTVTSAQPSWDGTNTAWKWTRSANPAYIGTSFAKAASAITYTASIYAKAGSGNFLALIMQDGVGGGRVDVVFNLAAGTYVVLTPTATATMTPVGDGFYRCTITSLSTTNTTLTIYFSGNSNGVQLDGTDSSSTTFIYVSKAQVVEGSVPGLYRATAGTGLTAGQTGTIMCFNSRSTCQDIANFTDAGATLRFAVGTEYLPKTIDCIPNILDVKFTPATVSLGEGLGGRASLEVTFRDSPHSDTGTGFDKYTWTRTYDPYSQGSLFGKFRTRHPYLQGRNIRVIRGLLGQALADMDTRHYIVESFNGPDLDGVYTLIAKDVLKLADGDRAQAPIASTGTLSAAIDAVQTTLVLAPPGVGNLEYPTSGYLNISEEIVGYTRQFNYVFLMHADVGDSPARFTDVAGGHLITRGGNTVTDTNQSKFGGASALFDGAADYLQLDGSSDFAFPADFTVDFWFRQPSQPAVQKYLFDFSTSSSNHMFLVNQGSSSTPFNVLRFGIGAAFIINVSSGTTTIAANTWYHVMVSRVGSTIRLFINGVLEGSATNSTSLVIGASRPLIGIDSTLASSRSWNGWIEEFAVQKGVGVAAAFTPPAAPYTPALTDNCIITRGQLGTTAQAHDIGDRAQLCVRYVGVDPANIISDLMQTYAGIPSGYIPIAAWLTETTSFLGNVYTATIAEPTSINTLLAELCDIAALAIWWDDASQLIRLQVLRAIATSAKRFTEADRLEDTLKIEEQPDKRLSQVWTYFGQVNPTKNLDQIDNYRSIKVSIDAAAEANYGTPAIRKRFTRWIAEGGAAVAAQSNAVQLARFVTPPRRISFELFREYSATQDPVLGTGYQLQAWNFQDATGALVDVPVQITRLNPEPDRFVIESEEMRFQSIVIDPSARTIVIDANTLNVNLRTMHDTLYGAPHSGITVTLVINDGAIIGSSSIAPALDIGTWPGGVTINVTGAGRIQGKGGDGGNLSDMHFGSGGAGGNGGTALYTRQNITISMSGGEIWSGGGGGGAHTSGGGGGGGAGYIPGLGGTAISPAYNGLPGTTEAGGAAYPGLGAGNGAGPGLNATTGGGTVGGSRGNAIDGNTFVSISVSPSIIGAVI
jgi:hypothetical protein